jgi:hypothetical protein
MTYMPRMNQPSRYNPMRYNKAAQTAAPASPEAIARAEIAHQQRFPHLYGIRSDEVLRRAANPEETLICYLEMMRRDGRA